MPKRLEFKYCRICGAKVFGVLRNTRKAYWYPRQCQDCFHKPRDPKKAEEGRMRGLIAARKLRTKPIGSNRIDWICGIPYRVIKTDQGWKREHRVVAEAKYGRKLQTGEHTHHIDENSLNNSPENLMVLSSGLHRKAHHPLQGKWSKKFDACLNCGTDQRRHFSFGLCTACYQRKGVRAKFGSLKA